MSQLTGILSPFLEKQRTKNLKKYILKNAIDILDIGCGETKLPKILKNQIKSYTGFDILESVTEKNKVNYPKHSFYTQDILKTEIKESKFDYIIMLAFIEHLEYKDVVNLFKKLKQLLKPTGEIILTTPHKKAQKIHELGAKIRLFSKEAAHEHKCFFDKKLLDTLANESNLKVKLYEKFQLGLNQLCIYENT